MLQTLLAERFKLAGHREQKVMPVYAMVVGKSGFKLKPLEGGAEGRMRMSISPKGRTMSGPTTMSTLAGSLASMLDRPVVDLTEIKGTYDVDLEWVPDEREGGGIMAKMKGMAEAASGDPHGDPAGPNGQSLFGALQEKLGVTAGSPQGPGGYPGGGPYGEDPHRELMSQLNESAHCFARSAKSKILKLSERNGV